VQFGWVARLKKLGDSFCENFGMVGDKAVEPADTSPRAATGQVHWTFASGSELRCRRPKPPRAGSRRVGSSWTRSG